MESVTGSFLEEPFEEEFAPEDSIQFGILPKFLGHHLRLAYEASSQAFAQRAANLGLRPGSFSILYLIQLNPGITQTALSRASARDKSTLTPALRHLEECRLIRREQAREDRRSYRLYLTPEGDAAARELAREASDHDSELDRIIGPERREQFMSALKCIAVNLELRHGAEPAATGEG